MSAAGAVPVADTPTNHTRKYMKIIICMFGALALAVSLSFAQDAPADPAQEPGKKGGPDKGRRPNPEALFKKLDTNADGSLTLDEFKAGPLGKKDPAKAEAAFKKLDGDADGKVTLDEFKKNRPQPGGQPGKGPRKGGKPKKDGAE